jgi:Zn-dependent protease with chaperone function
MAIETALRYPDISAQGFAHPADRAATAALHSVPMLDKITKKLSEIGYERKYRQMMLGNAVRLGEDQLPEVWAVQRRCANTFDIATCPRAYVTQAPVGNALTIGTSEPMTLISSGLAGSFGSDELHAVLAHEMGHVLADHVGLTTSYQLVKLVMSRVLSGAPLAGLPLMGLYLALLEWSRAAELTADRASALGTGDPLLTCRTLMRMAGGPLNGLNLDAFITQATEYEGEGDPFARYSRFWEEIGASHPFPVRRVRELVAWVASGEFDRQRSGGYLRRGQEPPPSAEFDAAFRHYRQRFAKMVERVGTGVQQVVSRFASWLDVDNEGGGPSAGEEGFDA